MTSIELLRDLKILSIEDHDVLTENKSKWCNYDESKKFNLEKEFWSIVYKYISSSLYKKTLKDKINIDYLDFQSIHFPSMNTGAFSEEFDSDYVFEQSVNFSDCIFEDDACFKNFIFKKEAIFKDTIFNKNVTFRGTRFNDWVSFKNITIKETLDLSFIKANDIVDLSDSKIQSINLEHSRISELGFLRVKGYNASTLTQENFENKETARIIKANFEKMNNITESNKYFAIEQKLYLQELIKDGFWKNKGNILSVALHQLISNSGTSWLRVLTSIILFTFFIFLGYEYFKDSMYIKEGLSGSINTAIQLIDPLRMFKADNDIYEKHQAIGFIIRIITIYLFYQFIMAFRNNTRRK